MKMKKARGGSLFFIEDFISFGSANTIQKALDRLVEKSEIKRVARGIYSRPQRDPYIGEVHITTEEIAHAIAKRDKARIIPTGEFALHALGLSPQVPVNIVYLTDGAPRKIQAGEQTILFKKTSPKNLNAIGKISILVIQALKTIGKDQVSSGDKAKIIALLQKEERHRLEHDMRLAPEWIREIIRESLSNQKEV
ncbi:DUF6088 family protein [Aquiflexum lacus]|uniref:DUF6088 family protein n=1 Tax=Aquiflexum lacus TaxID=2483805 RepID=UPI00189589C8|nr:DUF6088 family protein [Aquiflexum lacus]